MATKSNRNGIQSIADSPAYRMLPLTQLHESPHNPRKHYNPEKLRELAESIQTHGIITPLLARPNMTGYEIIAGHRRFRAAALSGLTEAPVVIREMTDRQALECLTIENLQREDVHPLEEAQGYSALLDQGGYDVPGIAAKVGKSESYVYGRLRLLDLIQDVQDAFLKNEITIAHARMIAPLSPEKQKQALDQCFETPGWGRNAGKRILLTVDDLKEWIHSDGSRDLANAPFKIEDAELTDAGPCTRCPRSSCSGLFAEDDDAICFDTECYDRKVESFVEKQKAAGLVAISTDWRADKAPEGVAVKDEYELIQYADEKQPEPLPAASGDDERYCKECDRSEAELKEDKVAWSIEGRLCAECAPKPCDFTERAVITHGYQHDIGREALICRNPKCPVHGEAVAAGQKMSARSDDYKAQQEKEKKRREAEEAKRKLQIQVRRRALDQLLDEDWSRALDRDLAGALIADKLNSYLSVDTLKPIAKRFGIDTSDKGGEAQSALMKRLRTAAASRGGTLSNGQMAELLLWLTLYQSIERDYSYRVGVDVLKTLATDCGINFSDIEKEIKAEQKAKAAKPAKKAAKK